MEILIIYKESVINFVSIKARYPVFAMFCGFCDKMGSQKHKIQNTTFLKIPE
jgi:hypothetical protein